MAQAGNTFCAPHLKESFEHNRQRDQVREVVCQVADERAGCQAGVGGAVN